MAELETEVQLIKRDIEDVKSIHGRLDVAIDKLTDVSNCINRMPQSTKRNLQDKKRRVMI